MNKPIVLLASAVAAAVVFSSAVFSQAPPFGNPEDVDFANKVWAQMETLGVAGVTGDNVVRGFPYSGVEPHGFVLDTLYVKATVDGRTADLVVKRNYGPEGVTVEEVQNDAASHLAAITIMFKREAGYDDEDGNWFWAKYLPDGSLDQDGGMQLAGRVAKGMDAGCIACHAAADGGNFLFTTNHIQ
ncbi:MAG TPA: cytochrome P460 family protein [Devosiaceae bacterium]|nr:cytochrome P460 family protein [Devosiaceae bacterium]